MNGGVVNNISPVHVATDNEVSYLLLHCVV